MPRVTPLPLIILALLAAPALGASFIIPSDAAMIDRADGIVIARVESMTPRFVGADLVTDTNIRIVESLKGGWLENDSVMVNVPGGFLGVNGQIDSAAPYYWEGNEALLFLEQVPGGYRTWGLMLGKFDFVETALGEQLLVRGYQSFPYEGWTRDGNPYADRHRFTGGFLQYIRERVAGRAGSSEYFMDSRDRIVVRSSSVHGGAAPPSVGAVTADSHGVPASAYTDSPASRWTHFQQGGTVTYRHSGTQPGFDYTGAITRAVAAWTNDPSSTINLAYAGGGGGGFVQDGVNSVVLNQPAIVPAPSIGYAKWYMSGQHTWSGETFWTIVEGDVVTSSLAGLSQQVFEEVVTHEIGHTIGLRHSDQGTPSSTQAVMKSVVTGTYGSSLGPWDREAIAHLYGTGAITPAGNVLDVDANGRKEALTDGLLVLRYLFGFRGTTLTQGAVGSGASRSSAAAIEAYLASIQSQLDIDGNGRLEALTDGLLVLRYLFGFRGTSLVSGAVGSGATRNASQIEAYLATL